MKSLYIQDKITYDGSQLHSLHGYLKHHVLGDSILAWVGPCQIPFIHMVDGEDLIAQEKIQGDEMLHFIIEVFHQNLFSAVTLQRLFASIVQQEIYQITQIYLARKGDDLYFNDQKLSISIASQSPISIMIHFAVNVTNEGTPVKTCSLKDFKINENQFAHRIMNLFTEEYQSILQATMKVRPLN